VQSCRCKLTLSNLTKAKDHTNQVFGNIMMLYKVESYYSVTRKRIVDAKWKCRCLLCGNEFITLARSVLHAKIQSCGCKSTSASCEEFLNLIENKLQIKILREIWVKDRRFDGYIDKHNIWIECDGSYWHSFESAKVNDRYKDSLITNINGTLFRFFAIDSAKDVHLYMKKYHKKIQKLEHLYKGYKN
jgi:hypothetical protein